MKRPQSSSSLWQVGTAALVLGSMAITYFLSGPHNRKSRNEIFEKSQEEIDRNLTTPANATFGLVWPIIYSGTAALAIHQALPSQNGNPRYEQARPWLLVCYGLNALFGYFFSSDSKVGRVGAAITTLATLPPALLLHHSLEIGQTEVPEPENTLRKSISLYNGWLTAASVVSIGNLLIQAGVRLSPTHSVRVASAVLMTTGGLGLAVAQRLNDPFYLAPFVAAFGGIAAKQAGKNNEVAGLATAWAAALTLVIARSMTQSGTETFSLTEESESPAEVKPEAMAQSGSAERSGA